MIPLLSLFLLISLLLSLSDAFTVHENSLFWTESMFLHGDYPKMALGYEKLGFKSFSDSSSTSGEEEDKKPSSVYEFLHRANKDKKMYMMYTQFSISRPTKRSIRKTFPLYLTSSRLHFSAQHEEYPDHSFKAIFRSNLSSNDAISFRSEFDAINHFSKNMNAIFKYVNEHEDYRNYRIAYYLLDLMNAAEIAKVAVGLLFCNRRKAVLPKYEFVTKFTNFVLGEQSDAADVNLKSCSQVDPSGGGAASAVCSLLTGDDKSSFLDDFTYWVFEEAELLHGVKLFNRNPIEIFQNYLSDTLIPLIKREYEALSSMKRLRFPICKKMASGDFNPDDEVVNEVEEAEEGSEGVDNQQWYSKANFYDFDARSKIAYFSKLKSLDSYASKSKSKSSTAQSVKVLDIFALYFEVKFSDNSFDHQAPKNARYFAVASICPLHHLQSPDNADNKEIASDLLSSYSTFATLHPNKCQSVVNFRNVDNNIVADRADMEAYLYTVLWSMIVSDPDASNLVPQSNPRDDSQTYPAVVPYSNLLIDVYSKGLSYGNSDRYRLGTEKEFLISFTNDQSMSTEMAGMSAKYNGVKVLLLGLGSGSFHSFLLSAFPSVYIDSVEASEDVFEAARSLKFNGFCDVLTLESNENDSKTKTVSAAKHFNISNAVTVADDHKCRSRVILADYPAYLNSLGEVQFQNTYKYIFVNLNMIDFFETEEDIFDDKGKEEKKLCDAASCKHVSSVHSLLTNQGLGIWRIQVKADYTSILKESITLAFGQKNIVMFKSNDEDLILVAGKNIYYNLSSDSDNESTTDSSSANSVHPCLSPFEEFTRARDVFNHLGLQEHAELYKYSLDCSNY